MAAGLYYPYIHIRSPEWLKGSLLFFDRIHRMLPDSFTPYDSELIRPFVDFSLLLPADLGRPRVRRAQQVLATKIEREATEDPGFLRKYGHAAAKRSTSHKEFGFQLHQRKLAPSLLDVLVKHELVWKPDTLEPYRFAHAYVGLHDRIGQAVMATIAVACAQAQGLAVVAEKLSKKDEDAEALHDCLITKDAEGVFDAVLHPERKFDKPPMGTTGQELFEFMLRFRCNLTAVSAKDLMKMTSQDRKPITDLVNALREHASKIPSMDSGPEREQFVNDELSRMLDKWREDRRNLSSSVRNLYGGKGLRDTFFKFVEKAGEKGGLTKLAWSTFQEAAVGGPGYGFVIGIGRHIGSSIVGSYKQRRDSPYRYLTNMEKMGVSFGIRSDPAKARAPI